MDLLGDSEQTFLISFKISIFVVVALSKFISKFNPFFKANSIRMFQTDV